MAGGGFHSLFIKSDGSLWGMGGNDHGQLGDGTESNRTSPVLIRSSGIVSVAAGFEHSLYIEDNGSLWGMGNNQDGQLGVGDTFDRNTSVHISTNVISVAAGEKHSLFVKDDGSLWGMGNDAFGQLGNVSGSGQKPTPTLILPNGVQAVAAGFSHSIFIKNDGSLWGIGRNNKNQLTNTGYLTEVSPVLIAASSVIGASAGAAFTVFVTSDGNLSGIGANMWGQLGVNNQIDQNVSMLIDSNVTNVVAGDYHTLFLKKNGDLLAMGKNQGALGNGGSGLASYPVVIKNNVLSIASGGSHSMYELSQGRMWASGANGSGQLGIGSTIDQLSPQQFNSADTNQSFTGGMEDQVFDGTLLNPVLDSNVSFSKTAGPYRSGDSNKVEYVQSFTLDSNGSFSLLGRPDWNGTLVFEWEATIENNNSVISGEASVFLQAENDAPVITILDRTQIPVPIDSNLTTVPENEVLVGYVNVVDDNIILPDLNVSHADGPKFFIDMNSPTDLNGDNIIDYAIKINGAGFNFENPTDSGGTADDRIYLIKLFANDGVTQAEIELSVQVTDVSEGPILSSHNFNLTIREDADQPTETGSWYKQNGNIYPSFTAGDPDTATVNLSWYMANPGTRRGIMQWSTDSQMSGASSNLLATSKSDRVYFNYLPDGNQTGIDTFTVKVEDENGNSDSITFTVNITAVNDDAPIFISATSAISSPIVIASGSTQSFLALQASDADDAGASFVYEIVDGYDKNYFDINSTSGQLSGKGMISSISDPDEDGDGIYRLQVRANEVGTGETVDQWVYVEINEPPYFVDKFGDRITAPLQILITEDEGVITWNDVWSGIVGLRAIDPGTNGAPDVNVLNWTVSSIPSKGTADSNGSSGTISYSPNANEFGTDTFTISALDSTGLSGMLDFNITIDSVNDLPVVERSDNNPSSYFNINEGTLFIMNFNANDDADIPENSLPAEQKWDVSGTDSGQFYIEDNGSLYFKSAPDREVPLDQNTDNEYNIEIKVSDDGTNYSSPFSLNIRVQNVNEAPVFTENSLINVNDPFFEQQGFFVRVDTPENSTFVYDPNCTDPEGNNFTFTLGMLSDFNISSADFTLNPASPFVVDSVTGQITLEKTIDYENPANLVNSSAVLTGTSWWDNPSDTFIKAGFHLELNATDNGNPAFTTSQRILVIIRDVNEPPVFQPAISYSVTEEDQSITSLSASDPEGDAISYGIEHGYKDYSNFSINLATGELSFISAPGNFEDPNDAGQNNTYEIEVFAQSDGTAKVSHEIEIVVLNSNDAPTLDREGSSSVDVIENTGLVLTFNATDEDHNFSYPDLVYVVDGKEVRYQNHSDQTSNPYAVGSSIHNSNEIGAKSVKVADFNRDGLDDILELNSTAKIRLFLNLGNDSFGSAIPVTSSLLSVNQILVADLSGDGYPDVIALDRTNEKILAWAWNNASTSFDLLVGPGNSSEIVQFSSDFLPDSLQITDINTDGLLDVLIEANGTSRLSWIENLGQSTFASPKGILLSTDYSGVLHSLDTGDINGDGMNDIILATDTAITIVENNGSGQFLPMTPLYTDTNGYPYRLKCYDLSGDARLDIVATFDRTASGAQNRSIILLNDGINPFANPIILSQGDLIEHYRAEDIDNDGHLDLMTISQNGNLEFFVNAGNGVMGANPLDTIASSKGNIITAEFANFDNRLDDIQFSISGGKDSSLFEFRPSMSRSLWFRSPPDYENPQSVTSPGFGPNDYQVLVQADSIGFDGTTKSVNHTLLVRVKNENDNLPVISTPLIFTHDENSVSVATLLASDADGDSLQWSSTGGRDAGLFSLSSNGNLSFKVAPDYEANGAGAGNNQYLLSVRVSDGVFHADQNLTIDLNNLNDSPPVIHNPELNGVYQIPVLENEFSVLELNITDADQNVGTLTKTLVTGKDSTFFTINASDKIEFLASPDYETPMDSDFNNLYTFDLNISDGVHTQVIPVFVEVINVNDESPVWLVNGGNYLVIENQQFVIDLNASDDFNNSIVFSIDPASPDHQFFDLNQSSGELKFKSGEIPDYERPSDLSPTANGVADGSYEITVNLSDPDFNSPSQNFVITILDFDELPTYSNSTLTFNEDTVLTFGPVDFNLTDPENEPFILSNISDPSHGSLSNTGDGQFSYQPIPDYFGNDSFTLRVTEGGVFQDFNVTLNVIGVNDVPAVQDEEFDYTLNNRAPMILNVLENDSSLPDDNSSEVLRVISWEINSTTSSIGVEKFDWSSALPVPGTGPYALGDPYFTFKPPAGFFGFVTVTYVVSDGSLTAKAHARINVTHSPEVPDWKFYDEFGYLYQSQNNWILHDRIGWIYVVDPQNILNGASWCWSDGLGWFWTGRHYFDYIYVNEFQKWMRWQGNINDPSGWSLMTDYDNNVVVTSEVFQMQRAANAISFFRSSKQAVEYVKSAEVFSAEEKNKILRELIFTNSSSTLKSYGFVLNF
jgi:alpha-tubulin suppressor-like RCC1 family protein